MSLRLHLETEHFTPNFYQCVQYPPEESLLPLYVGSIIINYFSNATKVAQWGAPCCSRSYSATDNGARDGRFNWPYVPPCTHFRAVPPESLLHSTIKRITINATAAAGNRSWRTYIQLNKWLVVCLCTYSRYDTKFCFSTVWVKSL